MLENIKLIIWDLDETLWRGTLSDECNIEIQEDVIQCLKDLTDMGIVNSICSKNDYQNAKRKLIEMDIWEYFVFASINWESKGQRIQNIIKSMKLRNANVLFIDDNVQNLEEAGYYCKGIKTALPSEISLIMDEASSSMKNNLSHDRLKQYKLLEKKDVEKVNYSSNEEFLASCNIAVEIKNDCMNQIDRLYELLARSNQLNFTKIRPSKEEFYELIEDESIEKGYITVSDKFGDYGVVGFFAIKGDEILHFTFSCRTLGMSVEQYVYMKLGCPKIEVVGEVVSKLNNTFWPSWINSNNKKKDYMKKSTDFKVLMKGPCDLEQVFSFIRKNNNIKSEFSYVNSEGVLTEGHNNVVQIATSLKLNKEEKDSIISEIDFFDKNMMNTELQNNKFDYVVLSLLPICNLGIYRRKGTKNYISLCEKHYDITDKKNWELYMNKDIFCSGIKFNHKMLVNFASKYEYVNDSNFKLVFESLDYIYNFLDKKTNLILLLGSEKEFCKEMKKSYKNRDIEHKELNNKVLHWCKDKNNISIIKFDDYVKDENDFLDTINHFTKRVYYDLSNDLVNIFNSNLENEIKVRNSFSIVIETMIQKFRKVGSLIKHKIISN